MLPKTYYIYDDVKDKRLFDGKLFWHQVTHLDRYHIPYFEKNKWEKKKGKHVTYSNYQDYSVIKNKIKGNINITHKDKLQRLIDGQNFCLPYIIFDIEDIEHVHKINNFMDDYPKNSLWFFKKAADVSYGGYDVFPIVNDENFKQSLENSQDYYSYLKVIVESIEADVLKNQSGNKSAGVRLRKNLRILKSTSHDFIKHTLDKI